MFCYMCIFGELVLFKMLSLSSDGDKKESLSSSKVDMYSNMISNLEQRLNGTDGIFQMNVASQEVRYKEQMTEMEKLISELKEIQQKSNQIETKISLDSIISSELSAMFPSN